MDRKIPPQGWFDGVTGSSERIPSPVMPSSVAWRSIRVVPPLDESVVALPDGTGDGELPEADVAAGASEGVTTLSNPKTV